MGTSWEGATFARLAREMTTGARWPQGRDQTEGAC